MRPLDSSLIVSGTDSGGVSPANEGLSQPPPLLLGLSFGLVAAGLLVLAAVLIAIYQTFNDPMSNKLVAQFSKEIAAHPVILSSAAQTVQLGEGAAELLAMLLFAFLAGIAALIGSTLVRAGVQVVSPQVQSQIQGLKKRLEAVVQRLRR